ncbi:class III poly(R)-hydroxyalkanoic acid synthase subunit PhaE [Lysobacter sp. KIS68-7]|uniref:class III poly(R)-hydroxyalkanoic acid synthase subunit PhaE n=1 Tax=Lysobacter sp. KIS68-7 TaxID=2904252 RepID=UPI001E31B5CA|nr:class III poly(R)-hydroxyalkanoic acid synthase subunit PhaE [Lysobacter sp. KIS68-7]UHQ18704.1 class III poly(R)-hydroxyalkanoic acid synthase subunit PhaE [Lysobacter sp. KIS68-7]
MDPSREFEQLARQYWSAWGDMLRTGVPAGAKADAQSGAQAWHDAVDWWMQLAHGQRSEVNAAVDRFNSQARSWYGAMQDVAARFAGQDAAASDIAKAWKQALGAVGENPFPELFRAMRGQGQQGLDQWIEDASPFLDAWKREATSWLGMPAFGFAREHQERLQKLALAQIDLQQQNSAYNALMLKSGQRAYELFEKKLGERSAPGKQLTSARALFDLWIDAAEEAYAEIALSPEFRAVYGRLVDAQMRVRGGVQGEVEHMTGQLGMPTRSEVDAAHKKIAQLEREVRKLRDALATQGAAKSEPAPHATKASAGKPSANARPDEPSLKVQGDKILGSRKPAAKKTTKGKKA